MFILSDIDIWRQHNNISSFKFAIIIIVLKTEHQAQDMIYFLITKYWIVKAPVLELERRLLSSSHQSSEEAAGLHCQAGLVNEAWEESEVMLSSHL